MARRPPAVARVLERVTAASRGYDLFLPGDTVLVGVSGGPDSVCLLYALHSLRRLLRIRLEVLHVDHRLRDDSASDGEYTSTSPSRLQSLAPRSRRGPAPSAIGRRRRSDGKRVRGGSRSPTPWTTRRRRCCSPPSRVGGSRR
jgi:hypothetical protein